MNGDDQGQYMKTLF